MIPEKIACLTRFRDQVTAIADEMDADLRPWRLIASDRPDYATVVDIAAAYRDIARKAGDLLTHADVTDGQWDALHAELARIADRSEELLTKEADRECSR